MPISTVSRRTFAAGLTASALLPSRLAMAQTGATYPERPIKIVVPFPPGGGADFLARLLAQKMSETLRQPMIIDNRPGAGTTIGTDVVAKAAPDGYTILQILRDFTLNPSIYATLPFDTRRDFAWIGMAGAGPFVLVANPQVPMNSIADLAALAKAQPGKISYGSLGTGGIAHICMETLKQHLGIDLLHVPYKGAGPALNAAVSGEVSMTIAALTGAVPFIRGGQLRPLAVGAEKRAIQLPDVPTIAEAGGADTILPQYYGFVAPAGTPAPVIETLNAALKRALELPDVAEKLVQNGIDPAYSTPGGMAELITQDVARFAKLVKAIGIPPL